MSWYHVSDPSTSLWSGDTYVLDASDVNEQLAFTVSFTDNNGYSESTLFESNQTVQAAAPVTPPADDGTPAVHAENYYIVNSSDPSSKLYTDGLGSDNGVRIDAVDSLSVGSWRYINFCE